MTDRRRVLFLCTHNSARSQMAEGWLRALGGDRFAAFSAGTEATRVRPEAIAVMAEMEVDIAGQESKTLERYLGEPFDEVVTVCDDANDACPVFPGARRRRHWSVDDPTRVEGAESDRLAAFRAVRDELRRRIEAELLPSDGARLDAGGGSSSRQRFSTTPAVPVRAPLSRVRDRRRGGRGGRGRR